MMPIRPLTPVLLAALLSATGCKDAPVPADDASTSLEPAAALELTAGGDARNGIDADALSSVLGTTEIPYPVYPNGSKYRVGGENGLKIVVFQTEDDFEAVDAYYRGATADAQMPRLAAMSDYVRYSKSRTDEDPWATYRPGIVIHEFGDEVERAAVGARASARTNIIMSF